MLHDAGRVWVHGTILPGRYPITTRTQGDTLSWDNPRSVVLLDRESVLRGMHQGASRSAAGYVAFVASPFCHDANLYRAAARQAGRPLILVAAGIQDVELESTIARHLDVSKGRVRIVGLEAAMESAAAEPSETIAATSALDAICYRPGYRYSQVMLGLVLSGLEEGIGRISMERGSHALPDKQMRAWLIGGPLPSEIAEWNCLNPSAYATLLLEYTDALQELSFRKYGTAGALGDPRFLAALRVHAKVSPFVGFSIPALTRRVSASQVSDARAAWWAERLPVSERASGNLSLNTLRGVSDGVARFTGTWSVEDVLGATLLISDVRRLAIERARRTNADFALATRHRTER